MVTGLVPSSGSEDKPTHLLSPMDVILYPQYSSKLYIQYLLIIWAPEYSVPITTNIL